MAEWVEARCALVHDTQMIVGRSALTILLLVACRAEQEYEDRKDQ